MTQEEEIKELRQENTRLKSELEKRGEENEKHIQSVREESRQILLRCDDLRRVVHTYREQMDFDQAPRLSSQTPWDVGLFDFRDDHPEGTRYFNPSITKTADGKLELYTRRWRRMPANEFMNDICRWDLNALGPSNKTVVSLPRPKGTEHHEDPRVVYFKDSTHLSCCTFNIGDPATQLQAGLNEYGVSIWHTIPGIGDNQKNHEKNWLFFEYEGEMAMVYMTRPHHVIFQGEDYVTHKTNPLWNHGIPRGGTPPVRVGDEYFSFFHSSMPWRRCKNRYYMGAYAFEAKPPFNITRMSTLPILSGSPEEPMNDESPLVVFPGGALLGGDEWFVVYGVNDEASGWIRIPHQELLMTMRDI